MRHLGFYQKESFMKNEKIILKKYFANAKYCFTVVELESLLFMFIKSLRLADFNLFVT